MEKFSEIKYVRPDLEEAKKDILTAADAIENAKSADEAIESFLDYKNKSSEMSGMLSIAGIRSSMNTKDEFYDAEQVYFNEQLPAFGIIRKKLTRAILNSPYKSEFEKRFGKVWVRDMEISEKLADERLIDDNIEEGKLTHEYSKTVAGCSVEFMGEQCNFYGLLKHMQSTDREERRAAFAAWAKMYEDISEKLDEIYDSLIKIRCRKAETLGYKNYIELCYEARGKYDYTPKDTARFRDAVRDIITPACAELYERQKRHIGVDRLHWYDEALIYPEGNAVPQGTKDELVAAAQKMYRELSPETGEFFDFMAKYELFDLETRPGKEMGGYCTSIPNFKAPFIFSNFNGTSADVDVLTHEAGHAFESYTASRTLPISDIVWSTAEINEVHSMAMEHLAYPWMENFFGDKADAYRYSHLREAFCNIPYLVSVDEFQHRVFENPGMSAEERRTVWRDIERKYMPWRDYDGNEFLDGGGFWMQKMHIFVSPFYYVEYAIAQLSAFSIYNQSKTDRSGAWNRYLSLCRLGGSKGYFETLEFAGIEPLFSHDAVKRAAQPVIDELFAAEY